MNDALPRSPLLMNATNTAVLVIDMQTRLLEVMSQGPAAVWNAGRLLDGARILGMRAIATEQYPRGLGPTVPELSDKLEEIPAKLRFSCGERGELFAELQQSGVKHLLLTGIETHVCVQQTALDLMFAGFSIFIAVDAVAARHEVDHHTALKRMEMSGATLTTTESALFEWCEVAGTPEFKQISQLVQQSAPSSSANT